MLKLIPMAFAGTFAGTFAGGGVRNYHLGSCRIFYQLKK